MEPRQKDHSDSDGRTTCRKDIGRPMCGAEMTYGLCGLPRPGFHQAKGRFRVRNTALTQDVKRFSGARSPSPESEFWRLYEWISPPSPKAAEKELGNVEAGLTATSPIDHSNKQTSLSYQSGSCDAIFTVSSCGVNREDFNTSMEICGDLVPEPGYQSFGMSFQQQFIPFRNSQTFALQLPRPSQPCLPTNPQSSNPTKVPCKRVSVSVERFPLPKRLCLLSP